MIVSRRGLVYCIVVATAVTAVTLLTPVKSAASAPSGWRLVFSDEFNGSTLDLDKWNTHYPWGRTNEGTGELEYYADDALDFQNGHLLLRAEHRSMEGFEYTSGMISSHDKFSCKYGYIEIRAKMPSGAGLWPAFWLLPANGDWPPEVDVLEVPGQTPYVVYMTNWWLNDSDVPSKASESYSGPDFSAGFHTYAIDWNSDRIIWYVDNVERFRSSSHIPQERMYILATLAVGGDWPGPPDPTTPFPSYYDLDYVRVWQEYTKTVSTLPAVDLSSASYNIGEGGGSAIVTVTLNEVGALTATVEYATCSGTATPGEDYTDVSDTLIFTPGVTSRVFAVPITQDSWDENEETVTLTLSNAVSATVGSNNPATLTIEDDDDPPNLGFSSATYSVSEDAGTVDILVTLDAPSALTVTVGYTATGGSATPGEDYEIVSRPLTFTLGVTSQTITVTIIDDEMEEGEETVTLTLYDPRNATISGGTGVLKIAEELDVYLPLVVRGLPWKDPKGLCSTRDLIQSRETRAVERRLCPLQSMFVGDGRESVHRDDI
jgi:beta-glucanase (GH16 family)